MPIQESLYLKIFAITILCVVQILMNHTLFVSNLMPKSEISCNKFCFIENSTRKQQTVTLTLLKKWNSKLFSFSTVSLRKIVAWEKLTLCCG